jgi:Predicted Zn-dependent proteases and their inactivated homologs
LPGCSASGSPPKGVTVVDDGTLPDRRGSLTIDDEGTPTQCTTLIEDGCWLASSRTARTPGSWA